jgi:D-alanyl-D-alanine carboxypeptidase (penicillin-binding protein 5/6)
MARELIAHEEIKQYTTIWTDTLRNGEFGLSNTNKLIRFYDGATGLKTGYTSRAGHCLAATAERDGVEYIAVVLHCESSDARFESAKALLSYAFASYTLYEPTPERALRGARHARGKDVRPGELAESPPLLLPRGGGEIERRTELESEVPAPVAAGDEPPPHAHAGRADARGNSPARGGGFPEADALSRLAENGGRDVRRGRLWR